MEGFSIVVQLLIDLGAALVFITVIMIVDAFVRFFLLQRRIDRWKQKHRKGPFE